MPEMIAKFEVYKENYHELQNYYSIYTFVSSHKIKLYNVYSQVIYHTFVFIVSLTPASFSMLYKYLETILKR